MRLDTACLVAPKPQVSSMPTRRAFLLASGSLAFGVSIGGYVVGVSSAAGSAVAKDAELDLAAGLAPTGDADLDELRGWALKSPIEELESHILTFTEHVRSTYMSDVFLWHGMERLVDRLLRDQHTSWPRPSKQVIIQVIEAADPKILPKNGLRLQALVPEMKKVR